MSDREPEEKIHKAFASLSAATDRAWQRRTCLGAARFWKVALEAAAFAEAEHRHLSNCPACRQRHSAVRGALETGQTETPRILVSEQSLKTCPRKSAAAESSQQLTFAGDPNLTVRVVSQKEGPARLELEHPSWPPATLVRLVFAASASAPSWTWLAPLYKEERQVTAHIVLDELASMKSAKCFLQVQPVSPPELTQQDLVLLRIALAKAHQDDLTLAAWREWGKALLKADKVPDGVRETIVQDIRQLDSPKLQVSRSRTCERET